MNKVKEITVEILKSIRDEIKELRKDTNNIRDEIKQLRKDTNARFEQMDRRFEQMDSRLEHIESDIRAIVSHFDRDYMLLANKVGELEGRFDAHIGAHPH